MSDEKTTTPELNLLVEDELDISSQGKFIKWALTWGKRIIVLTELVVILAFLSRFWLDTTAANLRDEIETKKAYVLSFAELEKKFRELSYRISQANTIEKATSIQVVYDRSLVLIPSGITVEQMTVGTETVGFTGSSDEISLANLVAAFRQSPDFTDISVERIAKKTNSQSVDFSLEATYGR